MNYLKSNDKDLRGSFPFFCEQNVVKELSFYLKEAENILVKTVEQYKNVYGKSMVD